MQYLSGPEETFDDLAAKLGMILPRSIARRDSIRILVAHLALCILRIVLLGKDLAAEIKHRQV